MMNDDTDQNLQQKNLWLRGLYMLLFAMIYSVAEVVIGAVCLLQFGFALLNGQPNGGLTHFGQQLSTYTYHIFRFVTFNSEYKPFPFDDWDKWEKGPGEVEEKE